jgi:hypothetical protein
VPTRLTLLAAAASLLVIAAPAAAQPAAGPAAAAAKKGDTVALPFSPPLGRTLRYRMTKSRTDNGVEQKAASAELAVTFAKSGEGYVMETQVSLPGAPASLAGSPDYELLRRPLRFRVNAGGEIEGMEDEEGYWNGVEAAIGKTAKSAPGQPSAKDVVAQMRSIPAEMRLQMLSQQVMPLLTASATKFPLGETLTSEQEGDSPMGPVQQKAELTLERVAGDRAFLTSVRTVPAAELEAAVRRFAEEMGSEVVGDGKLVGLEDRETYEVSTRTGLVTRYRSTNTVDTEEGGKRSRMVAVSEIEQIG